MRISMVGPWKHVMRKKPGQRSYAHDSVDMKCSTPGLVASQQLALGAGKFGGLLILQTFWGNDFKNSKIDGDRGTRIKAQHQKWQLYLTKTIWFE